MFPKGKGNYTHEQQYHSIQQSQFLQQPSNFQTNTGSRNFQPSNEQQIPPSVPHGYASSEPNWYSSEVKNQHHSPLQHGPQHVQRPTPSYEQKPLNKYDHGPQPMPTYRELRSKNVGVEVGPMHVPDRTLGTLPSVHGPPPSFVPNCRPPILHAQSAHPPPHVYGPPPVYNQGVHDPPPKHSPFPRFGQRPPLFHERGPEINSNPVTGHLNPNQQYQQPPPSHTLVRPPIKHESHLYDTMSRGDRFGQNTYNQTSRERTHQNMSYPSPAQSDYKLHPQSSSQQQMSEGAHTFNMHSPVHVSYQSSTTDQVHIQEKMKKVDLSDDQKWINSWLADSNITIDRVDVEENAGSSIAIPDARCLLREAFSITEALQQAKLDLHYALDSEDNSWDKLLDKVTLLKTRLAEIKVLMSDKVVEQLTSKVSKMKKKRQRLKAKRRRCYKQHQKAMKQREERHGEIDAWQARILHKDEEKKREKELKAAADTTLGEVRRKLAETEKAQDLLKGLSKLRQLRMDAAERKGLRFAKELDTDFEEGSDELLVLLREQLIVYEAEKKTLEAMLELEAEENREKELEEKNRKIEDLERRKERTIKRLLFGREVPLEDDDPMNPFRQYYTQADLSLEAFIQIRSEWDLFLVPPSTGGSRLPDGWVKPSEPITETWASVLKERQTT